MGGEVRAPVPLGHIRALHAGTQGSPAAYTGLTPGTHLGGCQVSQCGGVQPSKTTLG